MKIMRKNRIGKKQFRIFLLCLFFFSYYGVNVLADGKEPSLIQMEATAYCYGEITADGSDVRTGMAAMKKEWIGMVAIVYADNDGQVGDYIGTYEIRDTGGDYRIKSGRCIDIYNPNYDWCIDFGRKKVIIILVKGEG